MRPLGCLCVCVCVCVGVCVCVCVCVFSNTLSDKCKVKIAIFDVMQQTLKVDINPVSSAEEKTVLSASYPQFTP